MNPDDELLHTDSAGDALYAAPPRGQHGTLLYIHPTGESSVYLPTAAVDALRTALAGTGTEASPVSSGEEYPGELEHLRELRDAVVKLNVGQGDGPLNTLLWDHFGDDRYQQLTAAASS